MWGAFLLALLLYTDVMEAAFLRRVPSPAARECIAAD
jgi:hypothetical protein